jgi:hypothetical protein
VHPEEIALMSQLPNETEASQFMLKAVDFDPNARTVHPTIPSKEELCNLGIPVERHAAYE